MAYVLTLVVGLVVGLPYAIVGVKSPARPVVALIGLLGMVVGEQGGAYVKQRLAARSSPIHQADQ